MKNGVSTIVGILLMVAVTVLISAIAITLIFSFFSDIRNPNFVAFSISKVTENDYTISMVGGEVDKIEICRVYKNTIEIGNFMRNEIGKTINFRANSGEYVRVVCKFIDKSESVVFERAM
ncbi:MAG: type IV pilin N-terminal domain-containing protein [Archaeoglobaceae archaeon]|uniref:Type IV pilin n=1 Tax=Archaeoglobus fulgidus TaxID=2234 RepID=A0A7J3M476_ARCFL